MDEPAGPPKAPRWVKVLGIVAGVVVLLALLALAFGGEHGPGRHLAWLSVARSGPAAA